VGEDGRISPRDAAELADCFAAHRLLNMREAEIAAALGIAEEAVSAQLQRMRRKLIMQLGPDHPFPRDDPEGASS
jgi:DNA-directed RNA polymerase specialized sigma24 family protein